MSERRKFVRKSGFREGSPWEVITRIDAREQERLNVLFSSFDKMIADFNREDHRQDKGQGTTRKHK